MVSVPAFLVMNQAHETAGLIRLGRRPLAIMALWVASLAWFVVLWVRSPLIGASGMLLWWSLPTFPLFVWERVLRPRDLREGPPRHTRTLVLVLVGVGLGVLAGLDVHAHLRLDGYYLRKRGIEAIGTGLTWAYVVFPISLSAGMFLMSTGALPSREPGDAAKREENRSQ